MLIYVQIVRCEYVVDLCTPRWHLSMHLSMRTSASGKWKTDYITVCRRLTPPSRIWQLYSNDSDSAVLCGSCFSTGYINPWTSHFDQCIFGTGDSSNQQTSTCKAAGFLCSSFLLIRGQQPVTWSYAIDDQWHRQKISPYQLMKVNSVRP